MTIKELLADKGLSLDAFAQNIGVESSTLADYEQGKSELNEETVAAIKETYGVDVAAHAPASGAEPTETQSANEVEAANADDSAKADNEAGAEDTAAEAEAAKAAAEDAAARIAAEEEAARIAAEKEAAKAAAEEQAARIAAEEEAARAAAEEQAARIAAEEEAAKAAAEEEAARIAADLEVARIQAEEEAARIAAEEKAARKAAKKAAKKQKADEEAAQWVAEAIRALGVTVDLGDEDAVAAARDAYDSLTYDQEQLIPGDLLGMLVAAEHMLEEAAKTFPIEDCWITVKDVPYTGKKIKEPTVKVECGDMKLVEGEDYTISYDKKARDIGLYLLTVKGKGHFTGSTEVPFCVVPKTKALIKLLVGDEQSSLDWKCLKNITGCQIEYSLEEDLSDSKREKIKKSKDLEKLLKKLKAGKKYYVRVRIYAKVDDKKYYSAWSKVKKMKL